MLAANKLTVPPTSPETPPARIEGTLVSALRVRHQTAALAGFAYQMSLLAMNAKVTSAKIGDSGRSFNVLTDEIAATSRALDGTVENIRDLTARWTRLVATGFTISREQHILTDAQRRCAGNSRAQAQLSAAAARAQRRLSDARARHPPMLTELVGIADDLEKLLRIIDYIKVTILIESAHFTSAGSRESAQSPFAHLAEEMHRAAERIREVAILTARAEVPMA